MKLTIHRGTHEIGGNCVEIATDSTRIILDVGMPLFGQDRQPVDTNQLRSATSESLLRDGWIPQVPGLFAPGQPVDAILISHAHEDHTGLIAHSLPSIPIFTNRGTSKMMLAGSVFAQQPRLPRDRYREIQYLQPVQIGDLEVTGIPVDHSIFGAMAFLIRGQEKTILYSGDLRAHGRKPGMHAQLMELAQKQPVDVLLMEGTHIGHPDYQGQTEYQLEREVRSLVQDHPGLVLASFSPQHVDRLVLFLRVALQTNRQFVADVYTAFVLHLLRKEGRFPIPEATEWIRIFVPATLKTNVRKKKRLENFFSLISPAGIESNEILESPDNFLMVFRPSMLDGDFRGKLPHGTLCLYSRWEGYLERPDWLPVKEAIHQAQGKLVESHTSGHIYANDITDFIQAVQPRALIPIHTFEPNRFSEFIPNTLLPRDGEPLVI